jgi:hypothetical protein
MTTLTIVIVDAMHAACTFYLTLHLLRTLLQPVAAEVSK